MKSHRRWLPLHQPQTFSEKTNWRMVFDRRDIIAMTVDKLRARTYAQERGVKVPRLIWSGVDVDDLERSWQEGDEVSWVLKPNFSSGDIIFGSGRPDAASLRNRVDAWFAVDRGRASGEWAYSAAERVLVVEERLGDPSEVIDDYKFFVFDGKVACGRIAKAVAKGSPSRWYSPQGEPLEYREIKRPLAVPRDVSHMWPSLVDAAASLGSGFDFIRVDLYFVDGEVYFGELTPYHGGGLRRLDERTDRDLGRQWLLPEMHH